MTVISAIMAVFTAVLEWFGTALETAAGVFYNSETGLTLIGVASILTLGIGVITLVLAWVRSVIKGQ